MADDEYEGWSVSDLKKLLAVRGVDYSNVLERSELVALASKGVSTNTTTSNVSASKSSYSGGGSGGFSSWWERKPLEPEPDYSSMTPEDALKLKRSRYSCGSRFVTIDKIAPWTASLPAILAKGVQRRVKMASRGFWSSGGEIRLYDQRDLVVRYPHAAELNDKVSLFRGDMCSLEIDAVVNAANESLLGGGGIDGAIHDAAGPWLREECRKLHGCDTGDAKITGGHDIPAKYILHTVGPIHEDSAALRSCYNTCLNLCLTNGIRTVGFCCVSTGIYGYPLENASHIALDTVRQWLQTADNAAHVDRVIFVVFLEHELGVYEQLMPCYFPPAGAQPGLLVDGSAPGAEQPPPPKPAYSYSYGYGSGRTASAGTGTGTSPTRRTDSTTTSTSTATAAAAGATAGTAGSPDAVPGGESPARPAAHGSGPAGADA